MQRLQIVPLVTLLLVSVCAAAQTPADDVKPALEAFQAAWDARDVDALGACLHDPLIGYFQPGQVFDRPGMLELARTTPRQPIEVTHRLYAPDVYGDVAFALMPTHLKPAPEVGLAEFDGLTGAAVLLKTDGVWRVVAGCSIWDAEPMAAWVPEADGAQIRQLDQAAQAAAGEFQTRIDEAIAGGAIDWGKFAALFHPKAVVLGPTGEGGALVARRLKPDGETPGEDVPEVSFAPVTDRRLVLATGWGAMVQAYDVQASFSSGAPIPCRLIEMRCYVPDEDTWQYLFAAIVPKVE
jgi:ketosteroid isomerase-like protein